MLMSVASPISIKSLKVLEVDWWINFSNVSKGFAYNGVLEALLNLYELSFDEKKCESVGLQNLKVRITDYHNKQNNLATSCLIMVS